MQTPTRIEKWRSLFLIVRPTVCGVGWGGDDGVRVSMSLRRR